MNATALPPAYIVPDVAAAVDAVRKFFRDSRRTTSDILDGYITYRSAADNARTAYVPITCRIEHFDDVFLGIMNDTELTQARANRRLWLVIEDRADGDARNAITAYCGPWSQCLEFEDIS